VNGDGHTDLVVATQGSLGTQFVVLLGDGTGGFTSKVLPLSSPVPGQLSLADVNGDGHLDLIQAYGGNSYAPFGPYYNGELNIYLGDGHGNFQKSNSYPLTDSTNDLLNSFVADFNHDGKPDIALTITDAAPPEDGGGETVLFVFLNSGDGNFTNVQSAVVPLWDSLYAFGDFSGDGNIDLAITSMSGIDSAIIICKNNGSGTFACPQKNTYIFDSGLVPSVSNLAADLNHDGKTDLIAALGAKTGYPDARPRIATLLAKQAGGFYWYSATSTPMPAEYAQLADVNGDSKPDLVYCLPGNTTNDIYVLTNEGNGKFSSPQYIYDVDKIFDGNIVGPLPAALETGEKPSIFFGGFEGTSQGKLISGYLEVLINETK
jgi:hypothetical protein